MKSATGKALLCVWGILTAGVATSYAVVYATGVKQPDKETGQVVMVYAPYAITGKLYVAPLIGATTHWLLLASLAMFAALGVLALVIKIAGIKVS